MFLELFDHGFGAWLFDWLMWCFVVWFVVFFDEKLSITRSLPVVDIWKARLQCDHFRERRGRHGRHNGTGKRRRKNKTFSASFSFSILWQKNAKFSFPLALCFIRYMPRIWTRERMVKWSTRWLVPKGKTRPFKSTQKAAWSPLDCHLTGKPPTSIFSTLRPRTRPAVQATAAFRMEESVTVGSRRKAGKSHARTASCIVVHRSLDYRILWQSEAWPFLSEVWPFFVAVGVATIFAAIMHGSSCVKW